MHKSKFATKLVNVCAWCGKEQYGVFDDSASTTHGICQKCLAALSQDENKPLVYKRVVCQSEGIRDKRQISRFWAGKASDRLTI